MGLVVNKEYRWPAGQIPFEFDPGLPPEYRTICGQVMDKWSRLCGSVVRFVIKTTENRFIYILMGEWTLAGCVGTNTRQGNCIKFTIKEGDYHNIPHEFGHVIGLEHEHMRKESGVLAAGEEVSLDKAK